MAAICEIHSFSGQVTPPTASVAGLTATNIAEGPLRFKRAEGEADNLTAPVPPPASGTNYSWRKYTMLYVKEGLEGALTNLRFFSDQEPKGDPDSTTVWEDQVSLYVGGAVRYTPPSVTDEHTRIDDPSSAGYVFISREIKDANEYTANTPLVVHIGDVFVDGIYYDSPGITENESYGAQYFVIMQMGVHAGCLSGVKRDRRCSYRYDET